MAKINNRYINRKNYIDGKNQSSCISLSNDNYAKEF